MVYGVYWWIKNIAVRFSSIDTLKELVQDIRFLSVGRCCGAIISPQICNSCPGACLSFNSSSTQFNVFSHITVILDKKKITIKLKKK